MNQENEKTEELARQYSGPLWDRYQNYLAWTDDEYPKTFDEWLNS